MPIHHGPIPQGEYHRLAIEWNGSAVKIGRVQFRPKQVFVQLVDQPRIDGAMFKGVMEGGVITKTFDYIPIGYATSHLVKYSHTFNGNCHFSLTGKIDGRKVFTKAMRLDTGKGHFFSLIVGGLERFSPIEPKDQKELVTVCSFAESHPPPFVYLVGRWIQPDDINPGAPLYNPSATIDDFGNEGYGVAVAPPPGSPLAGRFLLLQPVPRAVNLNVEGDPFQTAMIAGFTRVPNSEAMSFIALTYPANNATKMLTADITP
jgi:hypothetical protein